MDQLVKLERVDLAAIQLFEPFPHVVKKPSQLLIVISADQFPRGPAPSLLTFNVTNPDRIAHVSNLPPIDFLAKCCRVEARSRFGPVTLARWRYFALTRPAAPQPLPMPLSGSLD